MSKQTAIRLPDDLNARLVNLASQTGRTVTYYMREAIAKHIDDLEVPILRSMPEIYRPLCEEY